MRPEGLLEREDEMAQALRLIESVAGGQGQLLLVEGSPGIGKTRVMRAIRDLARERGAQTLWVRGSELEQQSPFNVVRSLLEPAVARADPDERETWLAGAAGGSRMLLDPGGGRPADADDAFDLLHSLSWLAINIAQRGPLVLLVDDAHWLDSPSARYFAYLADRLEDAPILLVAAFRSKEPGAPRALTRLALHPQATILRPAALSEAAVTLLAEEALPDTPSAAFAAACHSTTGGNPFAVRSLLVDLAADRIRPDDAAAAHLDERVPADIGRALRLRLDGLPEGAVRLARGVAVLGDGCSLYMAARLAQLDPGEAAEMGDLLARVDLLAPGQALEFVHPLARTAVYQATPTALRSQLHGAAARMLSESAAPERVAVHLLGVEPGGDRSVVDTLRKAARGARSLGGRGAAIAFLRRALAEPPAPDQRFGTLVALGTAEVQAWDNSEGIVHLREALELAPDPVRRGEIAMVLAGAHRGLSDFAGSVDLLEAELARLGNADPDAALILESELLHSAVQGSAARADRRRRTRSAADHLPGDTRGERRLLMLFAFEALTSGEPRDRGLELARRALGDAPHVRDEPAGSTIVIFPIAGMIEAGAAEECAGLLDWMVDEARRQGSLVGYGAAGGYRAHARWLSGDLDGAEADALSCWSLLRDTPALVNSTEALGVLIDVLVARGDLEGAEAELSDSGLADASPTHMNLLILAAARLRLRLAQRRWDDALGESDRLDAACDALGVGISGTMERGPNRALALLGQGRVDEALETAASAVAAAERYGAAYAISAALRAHGLALGGTEGIDRLGQAVQAAEAEGAWLHLTYALLDHGAALRRHGRQRDARDPLRRAVELASRSGAHTVADTARAELLATGARPRRVALSGAASLTARERRVAHLAAEGLSNPEIAQALFITRKTVEKHIGEVLRKLDLPSRKEIAGALSGHPPARGRAPQSSTRSRR